MSRTITIDGVAVRRVLLQRDLGGNLVVSAEYDLLSGGQVVQSVHRNITARLTAANAAAAGTALDALAQAIQAAELS
jgi:hypothetical protein